MRRQSILSFVMLALGLPQSARSVSCPVLVPHTPSEAQAAFLHSDYERAAGLYSQARQQNPNDPELIAGLVEVLLKQQKIPEAADLITKAIINNPESVILQTALGLVQYREGKPWLAAKTSEAAFPLDPCYPRLHLLNMYVRRLNSMHKAADAELRTAHLLDSNDPAIRRYWLHTLPLKQRIAEVEGYLASSTGDDPDDLRRMRLYLDRLKKAAFQPHKACQLASSEVTTDIRLAPIMRDANRIRAFGLDVKLNNHNARLQIDTGASGLLISRSVAKQAGLEEFATSEVRGIGSGDEKSAYSAYVDSIKIGSLEFRDCEVTVLNSRNVAGEDGLIGMDVFSNVLVTLDYPMRKLTLGPLPPRPQDAANGKLALETSDGEESSRSPQDRYVAPEMKEWTRVYRTGHELLVPATLNQSTAKLFILDTGAFSTTISPEAAREVTKLHAGNGLTVRGLSGKVEQVYSTDAVTFEFGNIIQKADGVFSFDTSGVSKDTGVEVSGFIGFTTLSQLTIKIDYRDALVKFDYNPNRGFRSLER